MISNRILWSVVVLPATFLAVAPAPADAPTTAAVYLKLASLPAGSFEQTVADVRSAVTAAGWKVVADYEPGMDSQRCAFPARTLVADWPDYARAALAAGERGAFAALVRLAVVEDESGVQVSAVNPRSINRSVVAEQGRDSDWVALAAGIETAVHARLPGTTAEFGQRRERGRIGKTMGIMAGGPFEEKIETVLTVPLAGQDLSAFAAQLADKLELQSDSGDWRLRPVFWHQTTDPDIALLGVTSAAMESRSFAIVGAGGDGARRAMRCPGINHAAAYPLEVALVRQGDSVAVRITDVMFRMKMYFEDAGKMAFARNMGMPGSIENELRAKLRNALRPID